MFKFKTIMLATNSKGKILELKNLFMHTGIKIVTIPQVFGNNIPEEPEETGKTFIENAYIKAKYYAEKSGLPCLADDSGMCIKALDNFPGVYSKRFCATPDNPNPTDEEHNLALIKMLHEKGFSESLAYYECYLALYNPATGGCYTVSGKCKGKFCDVSSGVNGFAFDRYFWSEVYNYNMTLADLAPEDKNKISHRGIALKNFMIDMGIIKEK